MAIQRLRGLIAVTLFVMLVISLPVATADDVDRFIERRDKVHRDGSHALSLLCELQTPIVRHELRLTPRQDAEIQRLRTEVDGIIQSVVKPYSESAERWREGKIGYRICIASEPYLPRILSILSVDQRVRWEQIERQVEWKQKLRIGVIGDVEWEPAMSRQQREKFAAYAAEFERETKVPDELAEPSPSTPERERMSAAYDSQHLAACAKFLSRCEQLQTREQRARLNERHGKPFDEDKLGKQAQRFAIRVNVKSPPGVDPPESQFISWQ